MSCSKSTEQTAQTTPDQKLQSTPTTAPPATEAVVTPKHETEVLKLKFLNLYRLKFANAVLVVTEFENVGTAPIKAFQGKWAICDDLDNVTLDLPFAYTSDTPYVSSAGNSGSHAITPGEKICISTMLQSNGEQKTVAGEKSTVIALYNIPKDEFETRRTTKTIKAEFAKIVGIE